MADGTVRHRVLAEQGRDFSGLCYHRNISPTDIDGFLEFGDRLFVFLELKFRGSNFTEAQKVALERLVDAIHEPRQALAILAWHDAPPEDPIDAARCDVAAYRVRGQWRLLAPMAFTVRDVIDQFLELHGDGWRVRQPGDEDDEVRA